MLSDPVDILLPLLAGMAVIAAVVTAFGVSVFTGQRRSIEAISRSERKFRLLFENSVVGMLRFDPSTGVVLEANQALFEILGTTSSSEIPFILGLFRNGSPASLTERLLKERVVDGHELLISGQKRRPTWLSFFGVVNDSDGSCEAVMADITHQKNAAEILRQISHRIVEAEENERKRVARELHDGVNQTLSIAKLRLRSIESRLAAKGGTVRSHSVEVRKLVDAAMEDVRRISRNLRPSVLDDLGFLPAVRTLIDDVRSRTRIDIRFEPFGGPLGISPRVELALFRVVQESLTNIERHSRASNATVRLRNSGSTLTMIITDDGIGLKRKRRIRKRTSGGMGLRGMKERVGLLGGEFTARSARGRGTVITVDVPREQSEVQDA